MDLFSEAVTDCGEKLDEAWNWRPEEVYDYQLYHAENMECWADALYELGLQLASDGADDVKRKVR